MTTSNATTAIARAVAADVPTLSVVLARAFHDDPVFEWLVPDGHRRRATLPPVFAAFTEVYLPHEETYVAADGAGTALWAPPGADPFPEEQAEAFGDRMVALLGDDAQRVDVIHALLEEQHPAQPCFYLQFAGVVPERQGRGIGSGLLTAVLGRCDATGTPAYLEATSEDNRRLYQRHGFETLGGVTLPQGPPLWPMWREPMATSDA